MNLRILHLSAFFICTKMKYIDQATSTNVTSVNVYYFALVFILCQRFGAHLIDNDKCYSEFRIIKKVLFFFGIQNICERYIT